MILRTRCPSCGSADLSWSSVSGKGTVYSYTIAHRPPHPVFADLCPMAIAIVALEEGPTMMTNIINVDQTPEALQLDMPLEVVFEPLDDEISLPYFQPEGGQS